MEKNIKLIIIEDYFDLVLNKNVPKNTIVYEEPKRAKQLCDKNVAKIIEIRKCIHESK